MTERRFELRDSCPVCHTPATRSRHEGPEFRRCSRCDLRYRTQVMISDSRQSWDADYYSDPRIVEHHARRMSAFHEIERVLHRFVPGRGRLLDLGCGLGVFLEIAEGAGWEVVGVEASAAAVEHARRRVRGRILHGDFLDLDERESFDAVTCLDVLRTAPRPMATLRRALRALRPGGVVAVRDTNGTWQARSRARSRSQSLAHQYAQQWPARTMAWTLAEAGFVDAVVLPSPVFLEGREPWPRLQLKRVLSVVSTAVYALSRRVIAPNVLAVARRPPAGDGSE